MISYFRSKKKLVIAMMDLENQVIERERRKWFEEKMALITEYEGRIISASKKSADDRELDMLSIIESKDDRIRELELEIISQRNSYRDFKSEVQDYEILADTVDTEIQAAMAITAQLAAKFQGLKYRMQTCVKRVERKDIKLIRDGKS
jgi:hypothetical protein